MRHGLNTQTRKPTHGLPSTGVAAHFERIRFDRVSACASLPLSRLVLHVMSPRPSFTRTACVNTVTITYTSSAVCACITPKTASQLGSMSAAFCRAGRIMAASRSRISENQATKRTSLIMIQSVRCCDDHHTPCAFRRGCPKNQHVCTQTDMKPHRLMTE